MGFFDFFKRKKTTPTPAPAPTPEPTPTPPPVEKTPPAPPTPSPAEAIVQTAAEQLAKGEYRETLITLMKAFRLDPNYVESFRIAAEALDKLGAAEEKKIFEEVYRNAQNADVNQRLGVYFIQMGHYPLASVFLEKAMRLGAMNPDILHDLALAYARSFQMGNALEIANNPRNNSFWGAYLRGKCLILNNLAAPAEPLMVALNRAVDEAPNQEEVSHARAKVVELGESLARLKAFPNPSMNIREWHFIQYGAAILDVFDSGAEYVAGGRYVATWGTKEQIRAVIERLRLLLAQSPNPIKRVVALPERSSDILGQAIAQVLQLPFELYNMEQRDSVSDCLIVAAHSGFYNDFPEFLPIKKGQILFAANHDWLHPAMIAPELIGWMAQHYTFPWEGGAIQVNPETRETTRTEADERPVPEIAAEIAQLPAPETDKPMLDFYAARFAWLQALGANSGATRYNFTIESPVAGSYFNYHS